MVRISQISNEESVDQIFNVIVILLSIDEIRVLPKFEGNITMQILKVGDPIENKIFEAVVWN